MSGIAAAIDTRRPGVGALLHAAMGAMTHYDWYRAGEWGDDTDRAAVGQLAAGVFKRRAAAALESRRQPGLVVLRRAILYWRTARRTGTAGGPGVGREPR